MTNHLPQSSEERLREKITKELHNYKMYASPRDAARPYADAIMQAVKAELGAALGEDEVIYGNELYPVKGGADERNQFRHELRNHFGIGEDV